MVRFSIKERKKYVIALRERGYTIRKIVFELHMSTRDVEKILKEYEREEEERREIETKEIEENENKRIYLSSRSKALQLYKEGMEPLDVAIKLNISAKEANSFYEEYCALQYPTQVVEILTKLNDRNSAGHFINLFHLITQKGLSIEKGTEAIEITDNLSSLKEEYQSFSTKIPNLKRLYNFYLQENNILNEQIARKDRELKSILEETDTAEKNLEDIIKIKKQKEETFKIKSEETYEEPSKKNRSPLEDVLISNTNEMLLPTPNFANILQEEKPQKTNFGEDLSKLSSDQYVINNLDDDDNISQEKLPLNIDEEDWRSVEMQFIGYKMFPGSTTRGLK